MQALANLPVDLPSCAPLSRAIVRHLAAYTAASAAGATAPAELVAMDLDEALAATRKFYLEQHTELAGKIAGLRRRVEAVLSPIVLADRLTSGWLAAMLTAFAPDQRQVTHGHLATWRDTGVLRYERQGHPQPSSAAALLIARLINRDRVRGWLPSRIPAQEPLWWCWRLDGPAETAIACPVPLPPASDLPETAVLWTPWVGAGWDRRAAARARRTRPGTGAPGGPAQPDYASPWLSLSGRGAVRLAHPEFPASREATSALVAHWQPWLSAQHAAYLAAGLSAMDALLAALADALLPPAETALAAVDGWPAQVGEPLRAPHGTPHRSADAPRRPGARARPAKRKPATIRAPRGAGARGASQSSRSEEK